MVIFMKQYFLIVVLALSSFVAGLAAEPQVTPDKKPAPEEKATEAEGKAYQDAIKNLGANEFDVREKAYRELNDAGKKARPFLEVAKKENSDAEILDRIGKLLKKLEMTEGFVTLPSGLRYKILKEGTGDHPAATDTVTVHYVGRLENGTEFDSSYQHGGKPVSFPLNRVIAGWTEGLQLMKPGAKYTFIIPANLAYGDNPPPQSPIAPGATLIFDVELIEVKSAGH